MATLRSPMLTILATATLMGVAACGGSGSDPSATTTPATLDNGTFSGSYINVYMHTGRAAADCEARFGRMDSAGRGTAFPTVATNNDRSHTPLAAQPSVGYAVTSSGTMTLPGESGSISLDGAAALLTHDLAMSKPSMRILLRAGAPTSLTTLSGNFHLGLLTCLTPVGQSIWSRGASGYLVADGAGGLTEPPTIDLNADGVGTAGFSAGAARTYAIDADGTLTTSFLDVDLRGGITSDGTLAVLGGADEPGEVPMVAVFLKVAVGTDDSTLSGTYLAVGLSSDPSSASDWTSILGTVTADGAGELTFETTIKNVEGTISSASGADTYSVDSDGTLTSGKRLGAISQDGRFAFLCGEIDDGDAATTESPTLIMLVRR